MIPVRETLDQTDTLPGEEFEAYVADTQWVLRSLSDLYSDRETAIIREYATNAYDAQIEAGVKEPILVTLPSSLSPFYKVKDAGIGIAKDDLRRVFLGFGGSSKRENNELNGVLGLGTKSALAYTETFTVVSVKDSVKSTAVVMRKPDWRLTIKVVSSVHTDEANGTEVIVPIHNIEEFNKKAEDFFKFWLPGQVLVNGQQPNHAVGRQIIDDLYYAESGASYVVMGRVPYRIHSPWFLFDNSGFRNFNFVLYVDNGDVEFTPSREDLKYTDHTKNTLKSIFKNLGDNVLERAKQDVASASSHMEAIERKEVWRNVIGGVGTTTNVNTFTYKGETIPEYLDIKHTHWSVNAARYSVRTETAFRISGAYLLVANHSGQVSARQKAIVKNYMRLNNMNYKSVVFVNDDFESVWVDTKQVVQWDDMKAVMPKQTRGKSLNAGKFEYWHDGGYTMDTLPDDIDNLYYVSVDQSKTYNIYTILGYLKKNHNFKDYVIVRLPANRIDKFVRENKVDNFIKVANKFVTTNVESLYTETDLEFLGLKRTTWLRHIDASRIEDPVLKGKIELFNTYRPNAKVQANKDLAQALGMQYNLKEVSVSSYDVEAHYPLLGIISTYSRTAAAVDDIHSYINGKYNERRKDDND